MPGGRPNFHRHPLRLPPAWSIQSQSRHLIENATLLLLLRYLPSLDLSFFAREAAANKPRRSHSRRLWSNGPTSFGESGFRAQLKRFLFTRSQHRLSGPGSGSRSILTKLAASGKNVKKGELLVEFDRQTQIKNALDRQADYVDFVQQIEKKKADQAAAQAVDQTALKQAENLMQSASLELKRNEIVSRIDVEKNQQNYEEAKATFEQLRSTFDLKRKAAQAELRSLEIQRDRAKSAMEYAQRNTERLAIVSPIDGIVVLNTIWKGGQMGEVQEGDEVRPGVPFMQVVNAGAMQVRARVNQADISILASGQNVRVGLDAYPDLSFGGKIERIAAIGVTSGLSQKVRTFQVLFTIDGTDAKLMPDLSASVDVELAKKPSVLMVPRDAVVANGKEAYVLMGSVGSFEKKQVKLGDMSDTQVVSNPDWKKERRFCAMRRNMKRLFSKRGLTIIATVVVVAAGGTLRSALGKRESDGSDSHSGSETRRVR